MTNLKSVGAITRINFIKTTWIAYLVALLSFASTFIQSYIRYLINSPDGSQISSGDNLLLVLILAAILIPAVNFRKIMHLNGRKIDFFWACIINYTIISALLSVIILVLNLTIDKTMRSVFEIWDIIDIFGWTNNGIFIAFFRQYAFYLLLAVVLHTLTSIQTFWWGWVIDVIIVAIISVFTPIAALRQLLVDFFSLIIFNTNPIAHIAVCFSLAAGIYALNIPILSRKKI
ncbi:MAG: putative rane protein [Eubacterium sp.]|jgi:hypothetical protein|nr:putative rane protein [Eubacterium sp.]